MSALTELLPALTELLPPLPPPPASSPPRISPPTLPSRAQGESKVSEWLRLLPFLGVLALLGYLAVRPFLLKKKQQKDSLINLKIQKENPKVVNEINIEDLCLTKAAYCRCWRSKTFPACDGSHNKHNELTGDNVGPLILKKKEV
ncbi:CDGSH iron-sulfur domain-containing protein 2 isoform X1 [Dasypus novemcinctus]|uniref:CDGSH iron-sulfur domain-containing protein 2 isoform X1 n=1 Tax=Dasypus novemcinctus TaxID=9361 RepID=UPI0003288B4B|nr:CDGSH iron-sulfur domain-containing protein 2 isoform X1 [Dasypus novemcinctus]